MSGFCEPGYGHSCHKARGNILSSQVVLSFPRKILTPWCSYISHLHRCSYIIHFMKITNYKISDALCSVCTFCIFLNMLFFSSFCFTKGTPHWKPCQPYRYGEVERYMNVVLLVRTKTFLMVALALKISARETLCFSSILDSQARRPSS